MPFPHFADTRENVLLNIAAIKNNKVLLASDIVRDKILSPAGDSKAVCELLTTHSRHKQVSQWLSRASDSFVQSS